MAISTVKDALANATQLKENLDGFRTGTKTLSKSDLQNIKSNGASDSTALNIAINSYDTIDINGDGISLTELQTYYTAKGTLSSSINQTSNSFWQEYFESSSSSDDEIKSFWQEDDDSDDEDDNYFTDYSSNISTGISKESLASTISSITEGGKDVPAGLKKLAEEFDSVDADQDGTISLTEYQKFAKDNKIQVDGSIDTSED